MTIPTDKLQEFRELFAKAQEVRKRIADAIDELLAIEAKLRPIAAKAPYEDAAPLIALIDLSKKTAKWLKEDFRPFDAAAAAKIDGEG